MTSKKPFFSFFIIIISLIVLFTPYTAMGAVGYISTSLQKEIVIDAGETQRYSWKVTSTSYDKPINVVFSLVKEGAEFINLDQESVVMQPGAAFELFFDVNAPKYNGKYEVDIMAYETPLNSKGASVASVGVYHTFYIIVENGEKAPEKEIIDDTPKPIVPEERTGGLSLSASDDKPEVTCGAGAELVDGYCKIIKTEQPVEDGGGCLIATAAYGTELAPQVQLLREIRDNTVMSTESGAAFIESFNTVYYSFSPYIADMERENPLFQKAVRALITPMVSTLSIMTLADDGNELHVLGLGISVIALNLGMYIAAPAVISRKILQRR